MSKAVNDDLASYLRALKARTGHSYDSLARRTGASSSTLHRYCSGDGVPTQFAVLELFAKECKATRAELAELHRRWMSALTRQPDVALGQPTALPAPTSAPAPVAELVARPVVVPPERIDVPTVTTTAVELSPSVPAPATTSSWRPALLVGAGVGVLVLLVLALLRFGPGTADPDRGDASGGTAATVVEPAPCQARRGVEHQDKNISRMWTMDFLCQNSEGAALYLTENSVTKVAVMDTTKSWFVCWSKGRKQSDGNMIWYYTSGDRVEPGAPRTHGWGYVAAQDVQASSHPWPGMPRCTHTVDPAAAVPVSPSTD